jgi:NADP-dependent 3-hydroxy acid dehydrogenase YdfG
MMHAHNKVDIVTGAGSGIGKTVAVEPLMDLSHVGSAVLYMASLPLDTNVQFLTIMATKMPFLGRG